MSDLACNPTFMLGEQTAIENYRHVSLTSLIIKSPESLIHNHIMTFLSDNKLLCDNQHILVPSVGHRCNLFSLLRSCWSRSHATLPVPMSEDGERCVTTTRAAAKETKEIATMSFSIVRIICPASRTAQKETLSQVKRRRNTALAKQV